MTDLTLTAERTIAAPQKDVFGAWLDPAMLKRFMTPGPGMGCPEESPFSVDGSTVTLTFAPVTGGTHVKLTHVKFVDEQSRDNHQGGWTNILAALDNALT